MSVAYFARGAGESWAVIRLSGRDRDREDIVADRLSRDAAEELCFSRLEELPRDAVAAGELPLDGNIAQRRPAAIDPQAVRHFPAWLTPGGVFWRANARRH